MGKQLAVYKHFISAYAGFEPPSTSVSPAETEILLRCARDARVIVEIGTYEAATTVRLALAAPEAHVYTVDPYFRTKFRIDYRLHIATKHIARSRADNITLIRKTSEDASKGWSLPIDLCFIDGLHTREGIGTDLNCWLPHMKRGSVICFHDVIGDTSKRHWHESVDYYTDVISKDPRLTEFARADSLAAMRVN